MSLRETVVICGRCRRSILQEQQWCFVLQSKQDLVQEPGVILPDARKDGQESVGRKKLFSTPRKIIKGNRRR